MKKILLAVLFLFSLISTSYAGPSFFKAIDCKFDDGTTALPFKYNSTDACSATKGNIAVDTDWFPSDITISNPQHFDPVRHTLQFSCPTGTVVNLQVAGTGVTGDKVYTLNQGTALGAAEGHQFSLIVTSGMSYNVQHKTGTQNCSVMITETFSDDL